METIKRTMNNQFTHEQYRKAKVIHLVNRNKEEIFYFGKRTIAKEEADQIVEEHTRTKLGRG